MRHTQPEIGEYLVFFFKKLIQLYLLCMFPYFSTYCFKEVIIDKTIWILNKKIPAYEAAMAWNRGITCNFYQITHPILFVLFISLFYELLYQRGYQRQYFWTLYLKVLAYEAATAWNREIPLKILQSLIKLYLFCLLLYWST